MHFVADIKYLVPLPAFKVSWRLERETFYYFDDSIHRFNTNNKQPLCWLGCILCLTNVIRHPDWVLKIKTSHHHFYISVMSIRNTSFLVFKDTKADVVGHVSSHRAFRRTVNRKWSGKVRRSFLATHTYNIVNIVQPVQPRHCRNGSDPLNIIVPHFAKYEWV